MADHTMPVENGGGNTRRVPVDYPSNAKKDNVIPGPGVTARQPRDKIITGTAVQKKPKTASFFAQAAGSVWEYVLSQVIIPEAKTMLWNVISMGSERALWRDGTPGGKGRGAGPTPYNRMAGRPQYGLGTPGAGGYTTPSAVRTMTKQDRAVHNFNEIILETREEAEGVIGQLDEYAGQFGYATVADMMELCGFESNFVENEWGWDDLSGARAVLTRTGWAMRMPPTKPIQNR